MFTIHITDGTQIECGNYQVKEIGVYYTKEESEPYGFQKIGEDYISLSQGFVPFEKVSKITIEA